MHIKNAFCAFSPWIEILWVMDFTFSYHLIRSFCYSLSMISYYLQLICSCDTETFYQESLILVGAFTALTRWGFILEFPGSTRKKKLSLVLTNNVHHVKNLSFHFHGRNLWQFCSLLFFFFFWWRVFIVRACLVGCRKYFFPLEVPFSRKWQKLFGWSWKRIPQKALLI